MSNSSQQTPALIVTYDPTVEPSGLTSLNVQDAIDELDFTLDSLDGGITLQGTWDASVGTFPSGADAGFSYIVSVGGTVDGVDFQANDRVVALVDGASTTTYAANWHQLDYTDQVLSVNSETGAVVLDAGDIGFLNATSGLTAIDVQAAIDEVEGRVDTLEASPHVDPATAISPKADDGSGAVGTSVKYAREDHKHPEHDNATVSVDGLMSSTDKTKLDGIAAGAEVNVQSDWNAGSGDALILNKPTIPVAANAAPAKAGVGSAGTDTGEYANENHVHPVNDLGDLGGDLLDIAGGATTAGFVLENTDGAGTLGWAAAGAAPPTAADALPTKPDDGTGAIGSATTEFALEDHKHPLPDVATVSVDGIMSSTDKTKLDGVESGAEVNVQSDWNAVSGDAFILNKPTIPAAPPTAANAIPPQPDDATGAIGVATTEFALEDHKHPLPADATVSAAGLLSAADKTKLDGIASGAEVNVQSDWNAGSGDAFIANKPTIPVAADAAPAKASVGSAGTDTGEYANENHVHPVNDLADLGGDLLDVSGGTGTAGYVLENTDGAGALAWVAPAAAGGPSEILLKAVDWFPINRGLYYYDVTGGGIDAKVPAAPALGATFEIRPQSGNAETFNVRIMTNDGLTEIHKLTGNKSGGTFTWDGIQWRAHFTQWED